MHFTERKSRALERCNDFSKDIEQARDCIRHSMLQTYTSTIIALAKELLLSMGHLRRELEQSKCKDGYNF